MAFYAYVTRCDVTDFFNDTYPAECLIEESEWLQVIDSDDDLIRSGERDAQLVGTDEILEFDEGRSLSVRMPNEAMIDKMTSIAFNLKAQPICEEWPPIDDYHQDFRLAKNREAYLENLVQIAKQGAWWQFWK